MAATGSSCCQLHVSVAVEVIACFLRAMQRRGERELNTVMYLLSCAFWHGQGVYPTCTMAGRGSP